MVGVGLVEFLKDAISGERARVYASEITRYHRAKGSADYARVVEFIRDKLASWGVERVTVERYVADGKKAYQTWTPPPAWEPLRAELTLIHPEEQAICSFETEPMSLVFGSTSTPPGGLTLEVVDIGDGKSDQVYAAQSVRGKIVLTSGDARTAFRKAIKRHGAVGVLTDFMLNEVPSIQRTPCDLPDAVCYASFPVKHEDIDKMAFGFSLSHRQAERLRTLLKKGPVRVKALVDARLFAGELQVLTGLIPGEERLEGEVLIIAHLCHPKPGANDNASGCGLAMEIARALADAIASGKLKRPRLGLRFMFVPEMYGTIAYLDRHPGWPRMVKAGMNLDMVGESPETRPTANLVSTPWSVPSPLSDVGAFYMQAVATGGKMYEGSEPVSAWHYNITGFIGGSDHYILADSSFKVPCIFLGHWPDRFYHSNMDTSDRLDAAEFLRMGLVAASTALTIASPDAKTAQFMLNVADAAAKRRVVQAASLSCEAAIMCESPAKKAEAARSFSQRVEILADKDLAALDWVVRLVSKEDVGRTRELVRALKKGLRTTLRVSRNTVELLAGSIEKDRDAGEAGQPGRAEGEESVYLRLFKGPLDPSYLGALYDRMDEKRRERYEERQKDDPGFQLKIVEAMNYMDGKRTLGKIATLVSAEFPGFSLGDLKGFVEDLEATGLVRLR